MLFWIVYALIGILVGVLIGWLITIGTRRRLKHQNRLLQAITTQIPAGLFYQDLNKPDLFFTSQALALALNLKTPIKWAQILAALSADSATKLNQAYQQLHAHGTAFSLSLTTLSSSHFIVSGTIINTPKQQGLLITFQDISDLTRQLHLSTLMEHHKNILANALDSFGFPLFIRDSKGLTFFANKAVTQEKVDTLNDLSWLSLPFQSDDNFYTLTYGQETKTEEELNRILSNMLTAQRRLCEQLPCAVCLFNAAGQLLACSDSFSELWHLDKKWIQSEPSYEDYLDAIQDNGLLSRVADFANYKKQQREKFACLSEPHQLFLYLPDGKIIRRTMIPYVQGCVILIDENQTNTKK